MAVIYQYFYPKDGSEKRIVRGVKAERQNAIISGRAPAGTEVHYLYISGRHLANVYSVGEAIQRMKEVLGDNNHLVPASMAASTRSVGRDRHATARGDLLVAAGILALISALVILLGSALPFYTYTSNGAEVSTSVLAQGPNHSISTYAAEPITVVVLAIAAGIALITARRRGPLGTLAGASTVAGALLALGIQTTMLFVGYAFLSLGPGVHHDAGGILGLFGSLVLIAAGAVVVINNVRTA